MTAVRPVSGWSLPAGFAYDANLDRITNASHVVLPNPEAYWVTDSVDVVPSVPNRDLRAMMAAGLVPAGTVELGILSDDATTVRNAHAVQYAGEWFNVAAVETAGIGWTVVRLTRRQ
jgi:hypothetical protein